MVGMISNNTASGQIVLFGNKDWASLAHDGRVLPYTPLRYRNEFGIRAEMVHGKCSIKVSGMDPRLSLAGWQEQEAISPFREEKKQDFSL